MFNDEVGTNNIDTNNVATWLKLILDSTSVTRLALTYTLIQTM